MTDKEKYDIMHLQVLNVLRKTKKPMTASQIAKLTGYPSREILWGLFTKWTDDVIQIDSIPLKFKIK